MEPIKIAVLSVSAGAGHVRAAQALEKWALEKWPAQKQNCEVIHLDLMSLVPKLFKKVYAESYISMVESMPALWGYLYDKTDQEKFDSLSAKIRRTVERLNTSKFEKFLKQTKPTHIICTHFLPAQLLSRMIYKKEINTPVWVVITDFDVHNFWVQPHLRGYFVASDEVAFRLEEKGISRDCITVSGIPIAPVFSENLQRETCATEFGINSTHKTILLMSGGVGLGGTEKLAARLLAADPSFQIIALAGRNQELLNDLAAVAAQFPGRMFPIPFTTKVERLMCCSDVAVTKPGGLTTSECLALSLPMIIVSPIPGQEERNADYLLEHGAALKAVDAAGVIYRLSQLFTHPEQLTQLKARAKLLGKPEAAANILSKVLNQELGASLA